MAASKPILALGLLPLSEIRHRVAGIADRRQILLLDWPGFAYLHYGFGADELLATARRLVEGACNPLPTGVCPAVPDVLRLTSEVRHWLENRRRNVDGARRDFESAERGEIVLDRAYFEPVEAISDAHRAMLGRLLVLEPLASRHAPRVDGLKGIHAAVNGFEELWVSLESTRAELRRSRPAPALLAAAAKAHRLVVEALTAAIDRTHEVDCELMSTRSTDDAPSS